MNVKNQILTGIILTAMCLSAQAASDSWKANLSGSWNVATNWTDGTVPGISGGSNSTDVATFAVTLTTNRTVTVAANRNIGGITFANPANVTGANAATTVGYMLSSGSLKLSNGGVIQVNDLSGTNSSTVDSDITIQGNGGSATIKNDASGEKAGLVISGAVYGNSTTGNTTTLYLNGVSTSVGISGSTRNNTTVVIGDGTAGGNLKVVKNGTGLWTLNFVAANSTFTGGLYINEGTVRYFGNSVGGFGRSAITIGTNVIFLHGNGTPTSVITNALVVNGDFTLDGGANTTWRGPINLGSTTRTITVNAGTNNVFSGVISGSGGLTKAGPDDLILSGSNTYSGVTMVSQGELIANADGALGTNSVTVAGGAMLTLQNGAANNYIGNQAKLILNVSSNLNLNFTGAADTINSLSLDGGANWLPAGTYTAAAIGALGSGSLIVTTDGPAPTFPSDDFSGTPGTALVGSSLDVGGSWSNIRTDNGNSMNGAFIFAAGGGVIASNNSPANAYTTFNASRYAQTFTSGFTLSLTFTANGYTNGDLFLGLAETIDKGYFQNVATNDLIRFVYYLGGTKAGTFAWSVRDESVLLNSDDSVRAGTQTVNPTDVVRLSITVYPGVGLIFGSATNVTQNCLISKSRIGVNTPGLTNTLYAGMGWLNIATNSDVPAVISSFTITNAPDLTAAKPLALSTTLPPVMTGFAFDDMNSVTNPEFAYILSEHASIDIMHAVRPTVYDTVRTTYPEKIMIKQMAWGGTAGIPLDTIWPGHCLMKAGTKLTADVAAVTNNTVLTLQDYTRIVSKQSTIDSLIAAGSADAYVLLYGLDGAGRPDWSRAEHVKMVTVNTTNGTLTVQRGQLGSVPLALTNGQAAVARHMMFWSPSQWELNLSLESPRGGPFNMTAAEWFALQVAQSIYEIEADGVEMDVGRWMWGYPVNNPMDCDNNLVADHGYIDGINSFGLGGQVLQRQLRALLGPNRIVQTDGNDALFGQRGWKYMNGVQLESFPTGGYDLYSERFRHFRQWINSVDTQPAFSYAFTKTPTTLFGHVVDTNNNNASYDWRFRVGFAAALLTGMPHPFASVTDINFDPANPDYNDPDMVEDKGFYKWDEYVGGALNDWKWLGAPQGPAIQITNNVSSTNLLASAGWRWRTESNFVSTCSITNGEYSAVITAIPSNTLTWTSSYYPGSQVPQALWFGTRLEITSGVPVLVTNQEYTLEFEAKGNESWTVHGEVFDRVPRSLTIDGISSNGFHKPASVFLGTNWTTYRFTIIADSNAPPPLVFGVSEQIGNASIRNIRLYKGGSERWMREFKNGRLYLNMTLTPWTVDVGTGVVQRLSGVQIPELNNGAVQNGMLTIPVWDAVYLRTWTVDAWKSAYFTSNQLTNSAISGDAADPDLDGFSNIEEFVAGTNPTNTLSLFDVNGSFNQKQVLDWSSVSGRVYDVYWTTNLMSSFVPLQTNIAWPQSVYTSPAPGSAGTGFYQLKVRRP